MVLVESLWRNAINEAYNARALLSQGKKEKNTFPFLQPVNPLALASLCAHFSIKIQPFTGTALCFKLRVRNIYGFREEKHTP